MKKLIFIAILFPFFAVAQQFDFYGPAPFGEILDKPFTKVWTPTAISSFENLTYFVVLDAETKSKAIGIDASDPGLVSEVSASSLNSGTYGELLRGIYQMVDINTHLDNLVTPLAGEYRVNPFLHSFFGLNSTGSGSATFTDGGTRYISEATATGYVVVVFTGSPSSAKIKATSQWAYDATQDKLVEAAGWATKWLKLDGTTLLWTSTESEASAFFLADANGLIDLEIEEGSDFNPVSISYQTNATVELPEIESIDDNEIVSDLDRDMDDTFKVQLGTEESATTAASAMLDDIESTLQAAGASIKYPKEFYLALRENMLSQRIASTDIYGAKLGYHTIPSVYFTNASDDDGVPHPFMVIASLACSTRPNQLVDVHRPPGGAGGPGYAESQVTRNGKLGGFLLKIPLKDYGLIDQLLDNDLSPYGDLATDFDNDHGTTSTRTVYNYASTSHIAVAVDGVTIYPGYNNNLRFAVEDAEVTHSGIHVGGGLELHYHADGHAYNGNGMNLYNLADYVGHDHPPVIGIAYDGNAIFGRYESTYSSMVGYGTALDEFGGHDHGDGFGYHYHAHEQDAVASDGSGTSFKEHFLMIGAWRGDINNIPGFGEGKLGQFKEADIARYVGGTSSPGPGDGGTPLGLKDQSIPRLIYPNPTGNELKVLTDQLSEVSIYSLEGRLIKTWKVEAKETTLMLHGIPNGTYILKGRNADASFINRIIIER